MLAGAAAFVFIWLLLWSDYRADLARTESEPPFLADFELTDHRGMVQTDEDFAGRWMLVFFGFTNCPDVCPTTLAEVAQPLNLEARTTPVLKRSSTDGVWGSAAVQMLFVTGKGQAGTVTAADGLDRLVFVTTEIVLPPDATLDTRTRDQLSQSIEDDGRGQYIARDFGSTVNRTLLNRAVGGTTETR